MARQHRFVKACCGCPAATLLRCWPHDYCHQVMDPFRRSAWPATVLLERRSACQLHWRSACCCAPPPQRRAPAAPPAQPPRTPCMHPAAMLMLVLLRHTYAPSRSIGPSLDRCLMMIPGCLQLKQMYAIECICRLHPGTAQQGSTQRERSWLCRPHGACPASEPRDLLLLRPPGQSLEEHLQPARRGSPLVGQRTHAQAVVMLPCACAAMTRP